MLLRGLLPEGYAVASGTGSWLMAANDALHLLCAGFWIGGLTVLALVVVERRPGLLGALGVFSLWGTYAVFLLTVAGAVNALGMRRGAWDSSMEAMLITKTPFAFIDGTNFNHPRLLLPSRGWPFLEHMWSDSTLPGRSLFSNEPIGPLDRTSD
jgi:hypothetical protein